MDIKNSDDSMDLSLINKQFYVWILTFLIDMTCLPVYYNEGYFLGYKTFRPNYDVLFRLLQWEWHIDIKYWQVNNDYQCQSSIIFEYIFENSSCLSWLLLSASFKKKAESVVYSLELKDLLESWDMLLNNEQ